MRIWYLARDFSYIPEIKPVEVTRATESSVWVNGRRRAINSDLESFFRSWDQAKEFLLARSNAKKKSLQSRLDSEKSRHAKIFAMKPPQP